MSGSDLKAWIAELASDDEKLAGSARRRLVAKGGEAVGALLEVLAQPLNIGQYRAALRTLGDIMASGDSPFDGKNLFPHKTPRLASTTRPTVSPNNPTTQSSVRQLLLTHLRNHDGAERRSLINCLGQLGLDPATESALLALWKQEKRDDQLRVLAAALGKTGGQQSLSALETCVSAAPLVLREIAKARAAISSRQGGESSLLADKIVSGVLVRLRCRSGLGGLLLEHLPETLRRARETAPGQIEAELHGNLNSLLSCRLWSEAVFLVKKPIETALPGEAGALLRNLTSGPVTWRLHLPNASRGELLDTVRAAQIAAPDLTNSPAGALWEMRPLANEVEILPRHWPDTRFSYLRETIPAMTHAPLAAALAALSKPSAEDVVWDPFCGAGTELAERAQAGPYARLIGSDYDPTAMNAARQNVSTIANLSLHVGDAFELKFQGVNVLLTNPPYGRKVQGENNAMLLRRLLETASRNIPRGRIVMCSPMPRETWVWAIELGWKAITRHVVGTDGHLLEAQVFARE